MYNLYPNQLSGLLFYSQILLKPPLKYPNQNRQVQIHSFKITYKVQGSI